MRNRQSYGDTELNTKRQKQRHTERKKQKDPETLEWNQTSPTDTRSLPQSPSFLPTLTTASLRPPVLDDNASGLTCSSIGSQSLAKYVMGPIAQADVQNAALEEAIRCHMGMAGGKGASHASGQGSTEARALVHLQLVLRACWAGPLTFIPAQWVPARGSPAASPDGYRGSQCAVRESLVVAGASVHVPAETTHCAMVATGQCHLHSPVPVVADLQPKIGCQHCFRCAMGH